MVEAFPSKYVDENGEQNTNHVKCRSNKQTNLHKIVKNRGKEGAESAKSSENDVELVSIYTLNN